MKQQINIQYFKHPYAEFILGTYQGKLCLCDFRYRKMRSTLDNKIQSMLNATYVLQSDEVIEAAINQLNQYFLTERKTFDLPMLWLGSEFERAVWQALIKVGYSHTATYQQLADSINYQGPLNEIALANGANCLAIIVPCHRIVSEQGELVGYGGGIGLKKRLLELEQNLFLF